MHKIATVFLALNSIGVAVCTVLARFYDPGFWIVAYSLFGFGVVFFLLAMLGWWQNRVKVRRGR